MTLEYKRVYTDGCTENLVHYRVASLMEINYFVSCLVVYLKSILFKRIFSSERETYIVGTFSAGG